MGAGLHDALEGVADGDHDSGAEAFGGDEEDEEAEEGPGDESAVEEEGGESGDVFAGDVGFDESEEFTVAVDDAGDGKSSGEELPGEEHEEEEDGPDETFGELGDAGGLGDQNDQEGDEDDNGLAEDGDEAGKLGDGDGHGVGGVPLVADVELSALDAAGVEGFLFDGDDGEGGGRGASDFFGAHVFVGLLGPAHEREAGELENNAGEEEEAEPAACGAEGAERDAIIRVGMNG